MKSSPRFWTTVEEKQLRLLYPNTPMAELTALLNRPVGAIAGKAKTLGLKRTEAFRAGEHGGRLRPGNSRGVSTRFQSGWKESSPGERRIPKRGSKHKLLTEMGAKWIRQNGFDVIATEHSCEQNLEQPGVVAFRSNCSAFIEVIANRDCLADRKDHRRGLGVYRFYLCPEGVLTPDDLPPRWGLLYARGRSVVEIVKPLGNLWPGLGPQSPDAEVTCVEWRAYQHVPDDLAERAALFSIACRLSAIHSEGQK